MLNDSDSTSAAIAKRAILCVQPNVDSHPTLELALSKYRVVMTSCALDAVRQHNAGHFDAYVLDYWLPDWSGVGLCRQIRQTEAHAPILFFSAADRDEQKRRALRAGANVVLHVSDGAQVLASRLRTLLHTADTQNLRARIDEELAIQDELTRRAAIAIRASTHAREQAAAAIERSAQARARKAFADAGGTLATFERSWGQIYAAALAAMRVQMQPAVATVKAPTRE